jgi:hypothetical protein
MTPLNAPTTVPGSVVRNLNDDGSVPCRANLHGDEDILLVSGGFQMDSSQVSMAENTAHHDHGDQQLQSFDNISMNWGAFGAAHSDSTHPSANPRQHTPTSTHAALSGRAAMSGPMLQEPSSDATWHNSAEALEWPFTSADTPQPRHGATLNSAFHAHLRPHSTSSPHLPSLNPQPQHGRLLRQRQSDGYPFSSNPLGQPASDQPSDSGDAASGHALSQGAGAHHWGCGSMSVGDIHGSHSVAVHGDYTGSNMRQAGLEHLSFDPLRNPELLQTGPAWDQMAHQSGMSGFADGNNLLPGPALVVPDDGTHAGEASAWKHSSGSHAHIANMHAGMHRSGSVSHLSAAQHQGMLHKVLAPHRRSFREFTTTVTGLAGLFVRDESQHM